MTDTKSSRWYICTRKDTLKKDVAWECEQVQKDVAFSYNRIFRDSKIVEVDGFSSLDRQIIRYKLIPEVTIKAAPDCTFKD